MNETLHNKAELIKHLKHSTQVLQNPLVEEAFKAIDRADFTFPDYKIEAYEDYALPLVEEATLAQPTTVAFMLELLDLHKGDKVLEVGSGSGYVLALMAHIVGETGEVYGVEVKPELMAFAEHNLINYPKERAHIHVHAARKSLGFSEQASYDKIIVSGDLQEVPQHLIDQLKDNGILVAPVGGELKKIQRKGISFEILKSFPGFAFVPIV